VRQEALDGKLHTEESEARRSMRAVTEELDRISANRACPSDIVERITCIAEELNKLSARQEVLGHEANTDRESVEHRFTCMQGQSDKASEDLEAIRVRQEALDVKLHGEESEGRRSMIALTEELDHIRANRECASDVAGRITCFAEEISKLSARQEALGHEVNSDRESVKHFFTCMQGQSDRAGEELRAQAHEILSRDRRELAESAQEARDRAHVHMEQIAGSLSDRVRQELVDMISSLSQSLAALTEQLTHNEDCVGSVQREQQSMQVEMQSLNKRMAAMPREAASREELHGAVVQLRQERTVVQDAAVGQEELLALRETVIQELKALPELTIRCERAAQDAALAQGDVEGLVEDVSFMKARQELLGGEVVHLRENLQLVRQHLGDLRSETESVTEELRTEFLERHSAVTVGKDLVKLPGESQKAGNPIQNGPRLSLDLELAAGRGTHKLADDHGDVIRHELGQMVVPLIDGLRQELAEVAAVFARELATVAEHAHHAAADGKQGIDLLRSDLSLLREDLRNSFAQTCAEEQPRRGAPAMAKAVQVSSIKEANGWVPQLPGEELSKLVLPPKGHSGEDSIAGLALQQHSLSSVGRLRQRLVKQLLEAASDGSGTDDLDKLQGLPIFEATLQQPAGIKPIGSVQAEIVHMVEGEDTEGGEEDDGSFEQTDDDVRAAEELFCEFFRRHSATLERDLASLQRELAALVQEVAAGHVLAASGAVVARSSVEEATAARAECDSMRKEVSSQSDRTANFCQGITERVEQLERVAATSSFELDDSAATCEETKVNGNDRSVGTGSEGLCSRVDRLEEHFSHILELMKNQAESAAFEDPGDLVEY